MTTYPVSAGDIPASKYAGTEDVYFLFSVYQEPDTGIVTLRVLPEMPFAVNKVELRNEIFQATGTMLPTRAEIGNKTKNGISAEVQQSWPGTDWGSLYTMATGPMPLVKIPDAGDEDMQRLHILLLQNDGSKPVNALRWNVPSRLVSSRTPVETLYACLQTEVGLVKQQGKELARLSLDLPQNLPRPHNDFVNAVRAQAQAQSADVLAQFAHHHLQPGATAPETVKRVGTTPPLALGIPSVTTQVFSDILGTQFTMAAHFLLDEDKSSANVHVPMLLSSGHRLLAVDPDRHHKNPALVPLDVAAQMDVIPAPADFIARFTALGIR